MSLNFIITRWVLPTAAGIVCGSLLVPIAPPESSTIDAALEKKENTPPLPDDPAIIQLATLAGRTTEARSKIVELMAAGAKDEEIATWLAPILVSDPAWLETFILTVPEERRVDLVRETFKKMADIHVDSVWELIRVSPVALLAAKSTGSDPRYPGLGGIGISNSSPLAAEVLFDPANGFSLESITKFFRHGTGNKANAKRILEEWVAGRWKNETPDCVRSAWLGLRHREPDTLREIEEKLAPEMRTQGNQFEASAKLVDYKLPPRTDYRAEELESIGAAGLASLVEDQAKAAAPIPLDTLAQLPKELRKESLDIYFSWLYPFQADLAREMLGKLGSLDFSNEEKQVLLESALSKEWYDEGDFEWSMRVVELMPEGEGRTKAERELLEDYANMDPAAALEVTKTMPPGELRTRIEKLATENLP